MANATVSFLGKANNTGDDNALFLKLFSGEVLAAFAKQNKMLPMTSVRSITQGKSAQFPVFGRAASAEYHTPGNEITGQVIQQNESKSPENIEIRIRSSPWCSWREARRTLRPLHWRNVVELRAR